MRLRTAKLLVAALVVSAGPALSGDWEALAIGQSDPFAPKSFADAFHASQALQAGGFETVQLLRNVSRATALGAIDAASEAGRVVFYYSGPLDQAGTALKVDDGSISFVEVFERLRANGATEAAILIEDCPNPASTSSALQVPPVPEGIALYVAASAGPAGTCTNGRRLTGLLQSAAGLENTSLQEAIAGLWVDSTLDTPIPLRKAQQPTGPSPVTSPVVASVSNTVQSVSPVTSPLIGVSSAAPVAATQVALRPAENRAAGSAIVIAPPSDSQVSAIPTRAGLPEPSIIVGIIEQGQEAAFGDVAPPAEVSSNEITYENLEARRSLKAQNPALFETLVEGGAFDPPESLLVVALQTELQRMGCYTSRIDGDWGGGSRASVNRYFDQIPGQTAVSQAPTIDLFRQIIRKDDVICPAPVAASRPASSSTRATSNTTRRATQAPAARSQPAPRRQAAPAASSGGRTINSGRSLGGVFR